MPISQSSMSVGYFLDLGQQGQGFCLDADFPTSFSLLLHVDAAMSKAFYNWISQSLGRKGVHLAGSIASVDYNYKIIYRDVFDRASLSKIEFPVLDATSGNPGKMALTIQVAKVTQDASASGKGIKTHYSYVKSKRWMVSNFQVKVDGVDCTRVMKVDGLLFTPGQSGTGVALTVKEAHAAGIRTWFQSGQGKNCTINIMQQSNILFCLQIQGMRGDTIDPGFPLNPQANVVAKFKYDSVQFSAPGLL